MRLSDSTAVAREAARRWVQIAADSVRARGKFAVALSGGTTPEELYRLLGSEYREQLPWSQSYIYWGDERRVPASDPQNNAYAVRQQLLDQVAVPPEQVFPMNSSELARTAERDYLEKMRRHLPLDAKKTPIFDLVLLGLGADGHFASIYPGTRAVSDLSNMVLVYPVPQLGKDRMTLTLPVFNAARHVIVMAIGEEKAEAVSNALQGARKPSTYPAQALNPKEGTLTWLLDTAAASKLPA